MLQLENVTHRYGDLVAIDSLTLEVQPGEMFGLIGPDGAGKTTTLRIALGLLAPGSGSVLTCGLEPLHQRHELAARVGYLSQRFSIYGDLSVDENIAFFADVHGVRGWKARRDELLAMLRLAPFRARLADRLSGGMKQKLALACTLIHTPELLVMDEPTTGVDPVSRRDFWRILVQLQRQGLTFFLTTPYLDEAERCQRVGLIDHGRLLSVDAPEALRAGWQGALVELVARPKRAAAELLQKRPGVTDVQTFGERLHVTLGSVSTERAGEMAATLAAELRGAAIEVEAARSTPPTLEDLFIARIREARSGGSALQEPNG